MKLQASLYSLIFLCTLLIIGCPGDDPEPPPPPPPAEDPFVIKGDINSSPFVFENGQGDELVLADAHNIKTADSCFQYYSASGTYINFDKEDSLVINFIYPFKGDCPNDVEGFQSLFKVGVYPFATSLKDSGAVEINFKDLSDKIWTTLDVDQNGSSFEVTESKAVLTADLRDTREMRGTFNCKLYHSSGDIKVIQNGTFYIFLVPGF